MLHISVNDYSGKLGRFLRLTSTKARLFLLVDLQTPYCNFQERRIIFIFYWPNLNIICFVENNNISLRFCRWIFRSDTVKSDCPIQNFRKFMKYFNDLIQTLVNLTSFTVCSGDI